MRMHRTPDLIPQWTSMGYGARTTISNPPPEVSQTTIDAIIEGRAQRITQKAWDASIFTSPSSPYVVSIVEDTATVQDQARVGSTTTTADVSLTTTYTGTLSVSTGADGLWTTLAADFPMDVDIDGEQVTISTITGSSSPQTFTISARSVNGVIVEHLAGASIKPWRTATVGL
jgi:hypothetical protein